MSEKSEERVSHGISMQFYDRVLSTVAITPADRRFHAVADLVLSHAVKHLACPSIGVELLVLQCLPSSDAAEATVTSLYAILAVGTPPWHASPFQLHGAESLAGYAAKKMHPVVSQDIQKNPEHIPLRQAEYAKSSAAYPLLHMRRVAGCLQVSSTQVNYFSLDRLEAIRCYANLIALAFSNHDFYESQQLILNLMPALDVQHQYLASLRQKIYAILRRNKREQIGILQVERQALREIEQELRNM